MLVAAVCHEVLQLAAGPAAAAAALCQVAGLQALQVAADQHQALLAHHQLCHLPAGAAVDHHPGRPV